MFPEFLAKRPKLWAESLLDLRAIVTTLPTTNPHQQTGYSMSDFGVFVERLARAESWEKEARAMFRTLMASQENQAAEGNLYATCSPFASSRRQSTREDAICT